MVDATDNCLAGGTMADLGWKKRSMSARGTGLEIDGPRSSTLGEDMDQGGRYKGGEVSHGYDAQMMQGDKKRGGTSYTHPMSVGGRANLQKKMGQ